MNRGFTLIELMIGLLIGMFLAAAMTFFIGNASHNFQGHKNIVKDRSHLKKGLYVLSRELMELGVYADESGYIVINDANVFYMDLDADVNGNNFITYWRPSSDMDTLASQDPDRDPGWFQVRYDLAQRTDPVTGQQRDALQRDGVPVLFGIQEFHIELGADLNGDGLIVEDDGEWIDTPPVTVADRELIYGSLIKIRLTLANETPVVDGAPILNRISQEIYLRNRGAI
ncbi:MAG: prepilin-type N-terminal cleavage/methylation domain-containing protein [Acidobacteria bacterium]|nr:prepilin-type N-terminal cleavage/methylation domain-containing protein [Acidobacteriota bacterium]